MRYLHFTVGILAILATLSVSLKAQSPSGFAFQSNSVAKEHTGAGNVRPLRVQSDRYNNTYVLGYFEQSASFGGQVNLTTPTQALYLAKFDPSGNALWARTVTGTRAFARRGVEQAALFCDAEGHSYISMLIDSGRAIAGVNIAVPAGQRVATIAKYDAQGTVYFSKYVANGAGITIPDYRPMCADLTGNIYYGVNVRSGTQLRYGPRIGTFNGTAFAVVRLVNYGDYRGAVLPDVSKPRAFNFSPFSLDYRCSVAAIACNEKKVYVLTTISDSLKITDETGGHRFLPTHTEPIPDASQGFSCAFEIDKATMKIGRQTDIGNPFGGIDSQNNLISSMDLTARPDSGCYFTYWKDYQRQYTGSTVLTTRRYSLAGAFGANQFGTSSFGFPEFRTEYTIDLDSSQGMAYEHREYTFDKLHYCPDNTILIRSLTYYHFTSVAGQDNVTTQQGSATRLDAAGNYLGTVSIKNRVDVCPMNGENAFAAVGILNPGDTVLLGNNRLQNGTPIVHEYLAYYAGTVQSGTVITSFAPTSGRAGDHVVIRGKGFGRVFNVYFNGKTASFVRGNDSTLNAIVPTGATTGKISVVAASGSPVSDSSFVINSTPPPPPFRLASEETGKRLHVWPNPTLGDVSVTGLNAPNDVLVTDLAGRTVVTGTASEDGTARFSLSSLKPGIYLVRQGSRVERLVKE